MFTGKWWSNLKNPDSVELEKPSEASATFTSAMDEHSELTKEEHRALISAIFDIGLKESSPLAVMDQMSHKSKTSYDGLNLERIKSKLQKYRKKKNKSKEEFMGLYDETLTDFCNILPLREQEHKQPRMIPPLESLSSGEVAAYLTFSVMGERHKSEEEKKYKAMHGATSVNHVSTTNESLKRESVINTVDDRLDSFETNTLCLNNISDHSGGKLTIPTLTEKEKQSSIGRSFDFFMKLFISIEEELYANRTHDGKDKATSQQQKRQHQELESITNPIPLSDIENGEMKSQSNNTAVQPLLSSTTNISLTNYEEHILNRGIGINNLHQNNLLPYQHQPTHMQTQTQSSTTNLQMVSSILKNQEEVNVSYSSHCKHQFPVPTPNLEALGQYQKQQSHPLAHPQPQAQPSDNVSSAAYAHHD